MDRLKRKQAEEPANPLLREFFLERRSIFSLFSLNMQGGWLGAVKMSKNEKIEGSKSEIENLRKFFKQEFAKTGEQYPAFARRIGLGVTTVRKCINQGNGSRINLGIILDGIGISKDHPVYLKFVYGENIQNPFDEPNDILPYEQKALTVKAAVRAFSLMVCFLILIGGVFTIYSILEDREEEVRQLEVSLRDDAVRYFKDVKNDAERLDLFKRALSQSLDPEMVVRDQVYGETSLFFAAVKAGHAIAAQMILLAGASPHGYQNLQGIKKAAPFFLFPAHHVATSQIFTADEKRLLLNTMFENSVTFYDPVKIYEKLTPAQIGDSTLIVPKDALGILYAYTDQRPTDPSLDCSYKRRIDYCSQTTTEGGKAWCKVVEKIPSVIFVEDTALRDLRAVYVQDLISVSNNKAYFFVTHLHGTQSVYGVLEVLEDAETFRLFTYGHAGGRITGHCKGKDGAQPMNWCWRHFDIRKTDEITAIIDNRYRARLVPSCIKPD